MIDRSKKINFYHDLAILSIANLQQLPFQEEVRKNLDVACLLNYIVCGCPVNHVDRLVARMPWVGSIKFARISSWA